MIGELQKLFQFPVTAVVVTLLTFELGRLIQKKTGLAIASPLLISVTLVIVLLVGLDVDYATYAKGSQYLDFLLTPATVCLAVPLYRKLPLLKTCWRSVLAGILAGTLACFLAVLGGCVLFGLTHLDYVTLLPKSVTTAVGLALSEELGGYISLTTAAIAVTGTLGNLVAVSAFRILRIEEPIAKGVALGTSAHVMGTAKAMEIGSEEGAISSLSLVVAGLLTVVMASLVSGLV